VIHAVREENERQEKICQWVMYVAMMGNNNNYYHITVTMTVEGVREGRRRHHQM
jgi:hypothetical protein